MGVATDPGYDITQPVTDFNLEAMAGGGAQTLVSRGEYSQFKDVYIDGKKLTAGRDYTSEAGSTRITILNQTLAGDGEGTHTLGIEFRTEGGTLKRAAQNYVIKSTAVSDNTENPGGSSTAPPPIDNGNRGNNKNNQNDSAPASAPAQVPQQDFVLYIVEQNDSLWKIADKFYGQGESWKKIYEDNTAVIKNPNKLYAGQRLFIRLPSVAAVTAESQETAVPTPAPATAEGTSYRVQKGDMLWSIAYRAYGDGKLWTLIYEANRGSIKNPECIREGQVLTLPQR